MIRWPILFILCSFFSAAIAAHTPAAEPPKLTDKQKAFLEELLKDTVIDPRGCERASIKIAVRNAWANVEEVRIVGWLRTDPATKAQTFLNNDGSLLPIKPEHDLQKQDFASWCQQRYAPQKEQKKDEWFEQSGRRMHQVSLGLEEDNDLVLSAWLYRLGQHDLAAQAIATLQYHNPFSQGFDNAADPAEYRDMMRSRYAWSLYAKMVHAYMVRADDDALAAGQLLLARFPDQLKSEGEDDRRTTYDQAPNIVAELQRRKAKGTFGKAPPTGLPAEGAKWSKEQQIAYWISQLDEVDARQWGQPGGVSFDADERVIALIKLGDTAVPALIDTLEKDNRLTRSVHFGRDFAPYRTVMGVPEIALSVLMSIMRVREFEPASTGDNFTSRGEEQRKTTAANLRKYWQFYGKFPFDERMMKILTHPKAPVNARLEAAGNLASLNDVDYFSTTVFSSRTQRDPQAPNPALIKFKNPTVAEAILGLLHSELKRYETVPSAENEQPQSEYGKEQLTRGCLDALVKLGDRTAAGEVAKLARATTVLEQRKQRSLAANELGDAGPARELIRDFQEAKLELINHKKKQGQRERPEELERALISFIHFLVQTKLPEAEQAMQQLADPKHPYAAILEQQILLDFTNHNPPAFVLPILGRLLENTTLSDIKYEIINGSLKFKSKNRAGASTIPLALQDPAVRIDAANSRICDEAATRLSRLLVYVPEYHPLLKDSDEHFAKVKREYQRFAGNFRKLNASEAHVMHASPWGNAFVPNIDLKQPASEADVQAGRAIFHLNGQGKLANLKLPTFAKLLKDQDNNDAPYQLIVQAEIQADGNTLYGVVSRSGCMQRAAAEFGPVRSVEEIFKELEEQAAAAKN